MEFDKDLQSIQQVRNLVAKAVVAPESLCRIFTGGRRQGCQGSGSSLRRTFGDVS